AGLRPGGAGRGTRSAAHAQRRLAPALACACRVPRRSPAGRCQPRHAGGHRPGRAPVASPARPGWRAAGGRIGARAGRAARARLPRPDRPRASAPPAALSAQPRPPGAAAPRPPPAAPRPAAGHDRIGRAPPRDRLRYPLSNGRMARLADDSSLCGEAWLVASELRLEARDSLVLRGAPVDEAALRSAFGERFVERDEVRWDAGRRALVAERVRRFDGIVLDARPAGRVDPAQAA